MTKTNHIFSFSIFALVVISHASKHSYRNSIKNDDTNSPIVKIDDGPIKGRVAQTIGKNRTYYAFQGIPYAQPPLGELRFEPPQPNCKWNDTLDATADKLQCHQLTMGNSSSFGIGSEDCLHINVYTTTLAPKKLPVLVWIHGGGFVYGNSSYANYGPDYLLEKDIVFVSFNYRLNVFGFLSTGDLNLPGNNGLKDQVLALKWIQKNIAHFGGDPNSVTVFGQSAGSAAVSYLQLSHSCEGLFHRLILQSGSALCKWALSRHPRDDAYKLAQTLKADLSSTKSIVDSLKKVDTSELLDAAREILSEAFVRDSLNEFPFVPVIEPKHPGAFFTRKAHELVSKGDYNQVPTIIGFTSNEEISVQYSEVPILDPSYLTPFDVNTTRLVPVDMNVNSGLFTRVIGAEIKRHYFGLVEPIASSYGNFIKFLSDDIFVRPVRETVWQQSKHSTVYFYRFSYEGNLSYVRNRTYLGAGHAEDLFYLFTSPFQATFKDVVTRDRMVKMWTNFAKTSNPTPDPGDYILQNVTWAPARSIKNELTFLDIGEDLVLGLNPDNKNMKFWNNLYKNNGHPPYDTY